MKTVQHDPLCVLTYKPRKESQVSPQALLSVVQPAAGETGSSSCCFLPADIRCIACNSYRLSAAAFKVCLVHQVWVNSHLCRKTWASALQGLQFCFLSVQNQTAAWLKSWTSVLQCHHSTEQVGAGSLSNQEKSLHTAPISSCGTPRPASTASTAHTSALYKPFLPQSRKICCQGLNSV